MTIYLGSESGSEPLGALVSFHDGFSTRKTPVYTVDGKSYLRTGSVLIGEESNYPDAYSEFGWPGQFFTTVPTGLPASSNPTLVYFNNQWLFGNNNGVMRSSVDGVTWNNYASPTTGIIRGFASSGSVLVMASSFGVYTSSTGLEGSWTLRNSTDVQNIAFGGGRWIAGRGSGGGFITATTADITNWTVSTPAVGIFTGQSIDYGNGVWIATSSSTYFTSTDSVTWVQRTLPEGNITSSLRFGAGFFHVVTSSGSNASAPRFYYKSSDGINWTVPVQILPSMGYPAGSKSAIGVDARGGVFLGLVGLNATQLPGIGYTPDGVKFTNKVTTTPTNTDAVLAIGVNDSIVIGVSTTGTLYYSRRSLGAPNEDKDGSTIKYMRIK